jgi:hypothetical protein
MRYESLYAFGGFMADADAICKHPVDDLLTDARAYTVWDRPEGDPFRGVCPILACEPDNPFVGRVIARLLDTDPGALRKAEVSTGNRFLARVLREERPPPEAVTIWPMHYFLPWHKSDPDTRYSGPDTVYAEQQFGTSRWAYNRAQGESDERLDTLTLVARRTQTLDRLIGGRGRPLSPLRGQDRAAAEAARKAADRYRALEERDALDAPFRDLNTALCDAMLGAGIDPPRFHGLHFYRPMQGQGLIGSKLRSRAARLRHRLVGWLGSARHALLLGFDTGHLALAAHRLAPDLRIAAVEGGRWFREKDPDPPRKDVYAPAAAAWLNAQCSGRIAAHATDEAAFLNRLCEETSAPRFDLVVVANADIRLLRLVAALRPLMSEDAVLVLAGDRGDAGPAQAQRLMLQRIAYPPFDSLVLANGVGSYAALRLVARAPATAGT